MADSDASCHSHRRLRVSSTLHEDVKQFGKQHLFDGNDETCWNSSNVRAPRDLCVFPPIIQGCLSRPCLMRAFLNLSYLTRPSSRTQGASQFITIKFSKPVNPASVSIMFQGGFVAKVRITSWFLPLDAAHSIFARTARSTCRPSETSPSSSRRQL